MKDVSIQNWRSRLNESSKSEHYKQFKSLLEVEKIFIFRSELSWQKNDRKVSLFKS